MLNSNIYLHKCKICPIFVSTIKNNNIMKTINFNGKPTVIITEMQFELELSYIGMSFKGGWKQWSNRDIEMLEEKLNISANPILPYEGFIKLHDLNYVWED